MRARQVSRPVAASQARLQLVLILLAAWNGVTFILQLVNASVLAVGEIDGLLGARTLAGASGVLAVAYAYAARSPLRYRVIVWLGMIEQIVALFSYTFHIARGDLGVGEAWLPIIVAAIFLVLLLATLPRQTDTIGT
jgi:hypothetical protein